MRFWKEFGAFRWLFVGYAVLGAFVLAAEAADVVAIELFRDPLELGGPADTHPWKGSFSVLGVICWSAAAAVCFLAGAVVRASGRDRRRSTFLLATGALFTILGLDDGLLIHDHWAERVTGGWDASQPIVSALLFLAIITWLVVFRRDIAASRAFLVVLAFSGLLAAEAIDVATELDIRSAAANLTEEALEFASVVTWLVFACGEAWRSLRGTAAEAPAATLEPSRP
jgi:hypothetical protein